MARTKTNFQVVKELKEFWETNIIKRGFITHDQKEQVEKICEIKERDIFGLQDLRDFTVLLLSQMSESARNDSDWEKFDKLNDCMSAVTHVIDSRLYEVDVW